MVKKKFRLVFIATELGSSLHATRQMRTRNFAFSLLASKTNKQKSNNDQTG